MQTAAKISKTSKLAASQNLNCSHGSRDLAA